MKLVSVIITTYRGYEYIERTIKSVIGQNYSNIEIIIVDDNGRGTLEQIKTEKIVSKYKDEIKYIVHEYNMNGSAARNTGLRESKGDYICFLDDDDLMLPERIKRCVLCLEENTEFDGVFVDVLCADQYMTPTYKVEVRDEGCLFKEVMLKDMYFGTGSNIFITRKAFLEVGFFDERFRRHQDLEYMIRFYDNHITTFIPEILLVKSKNQVDNIPSYKKMKEVKDLYTNKFSKELESFTPEEREEFQARNESELRLSKMLQSDERFNYNAYKKLGRNQKMIFWLNKTRINRLHMFSFINRMRKMVLSTKVYSSLNDTVIDFLKEYK